MGGRDRGVQVFDGESRESIRRQLSVSSERESEIKIKEEESANTTYLASGQLSIAYNRFL